MITLLDPVSLEERLLGVGHFFFLFLSFTKNIKVQ